VKVPERVRLDFVAPVRGAPLTGMALCIAGLAATIAVGVAFNAELVARSRLDAELGAIAEPRHRPATPVTAKAAEEAEAIERELSIPWSALLAELESASHDTATKIALLQVEPDPGKHTVRITAEARTLPDALNYLERLQQSKMLRYPMLESHERRKDDPEHPFRIKLAAEWRT
jgi:hypothetical protein